MNLESNSVVSLYVVRNSQNKFFGGFNSSTGKAHFVNDPLDAKKFTNKYDVKLRPEETLVEIVVDLRKSEHSVSEPFRPQLKKRSSFKD